MEANARYQEQLSKYDREALVNGLLEQMVSENRIPQVVQDVYLRSNYYGRHYARRIGVLKDDITPLHRDYLKYIRAYRANLIAGESKILRLSEAESTKLRCKVLSRDNYACAICLKTNKDEELHVHHIVPLSSYGTNEIANLVTLCYQCHNKQHPGFKVTRNLKRRKKK